MVVSVGVHGGEGRRDPVLWYLIPSLDHTKAGGIVELLAWVLANDASLNGICSNQ